MNPAFLNIILSSHISNQVCDPYEENDENPLPDPNQIDIVDSIYDEIVEPVAQVVQVINQVTVVDEKLFSKSWGCFFF